jgi:hypothetical protein
MSYSSSVLSMPVFFPPTLVILKNLFVLLESKIVLDDFEIHFTQRHGVNVGDIIRHLEKRLTTLESRK